MPVWAALALGIDKAENLAFVPERMNTTLTVPSLIAGKVYTMASSAELAIAKGAKIRLVAGGFREAADLERDVVFLGERRQPVEDDWIDVRAAIQHRAAAEFDLAVLVLVDRRAISRVSHIDRDAQLRIDRVRAGLCAAQADLFLDRRD